MALHDEADLGEGLLQCGILSPQGGQRLADLAHGAPASRRAAATRRAARSRKEKLVARNRSSRLSCAPASGSGPDARELAHPYTRSRDATASPLGPTPRAAPSPPRQAPASAQPPQIGRRPGTARGAPSAGAWGAPGAPQLISVESAGHQSGPWPCRARPPPR